MRAAHVEVDELLGGIGAGGAAGSGEAAVTTLTVSPYRSSGIGACKWAQLSAAPSRCYVTAFAAGSLGWHGARGVAPQALRKGPRRPRAPSTTMWWRDDMEEDEEDEMEWEEEEEA